MRAVHGNVLFRLTLLFGHQSRRSGEMTHALSHGKGSLLFPVTVKKKKKNLSVTSFWGRPKVTVLHQTSCQLFVYSMNPQSPMCHQYACTKHIFHDNQSVQISAVTQKMRMFSGWKHKQIVASILPLFIIGSMGNLLIA